jgi:hypothetical protein
MKNASVQQSLLMEPLPFPLSSRLPRLAVGAKPRDLQFRDLSWKREILSSNRIVISTGAYPDFLPRCAG